MNESCEALAALVAAGDDAITGQLDRALLLVASASDPGVDVEREISRLDALAEQAPQGSPAELALWLFGSGRFVGNAADYYDPQNSFLNRVLDRGRGIPITLSALFIEVARRHDLRVDPIGMPGHFVTRIAPDTYVDAFGAGAVLTGVGCEKIFQGITQQQVPLPPGSLDVISSTSMLQRVLANLHGIARRSDDRHLLEVALRMRVAMPSPRAPELLEFAQFVASKGDWGTAASVTERVCDMVPEARAEPLMRQAQQWRARLN